MLKLIECKEKYVNDFRRSYKKWWQAHTYIEKTPDGMVEKYELLDINDKELSRYFLSEHVYPDMMWRPLKKVRTGDDSIKNSKDDIMKALGIIVDRVQEWLRSDRTDYDEWHRQLCTEVTERINNMALKGKYLPVAFGKGQKAVNMLMKYLSSCDNASDYEDRFSGCHMVLDSYILAWYRKYIDSGQHTSWSSLEYEEYACIQKKIKAYFAPMGKHPFTEEWQIWYNVRNDLPIDADYLLEEAPSKAAPVELSDEDICRAYFEMNEKKREKALYSFICGMFAESSFEVSVCPGDYTKNQIKIVRKGSRWRELDFHFEVVFPNCTEFLNTKKFTVNAHLEKNRREAYPKAREYFRARTGIDLNIRNYTLYSAELDNVSFMGRENIARTINRLSELLSSGEFARLGQLADEFFDI